MAETKIGPYTLEKQLVSTRWGSLYMGRLPNGDRCALKLFDLGTGFSVESNEENKAIWRRRFEQERFLLADLHHPHIVPLIGQGNDERGMPYYVMPYLEANLIGEIGRDIGRNVPVARLAPVRRPKSMPVARSVAILRQLLRGVSWLHEQGIVHRDLKPGNILMTRRKQGRVMIGDLGMASVNGRSLNADGEFLGSRDYAAPELNAGGRATSPSLDIYSVGAIAFRMITGYPPRDGNRYASEVIDGVPADIERIVGAALSPDPAERPGSAKTMLAEIEAFTQKRAA